jgi:hypothetical protein
MVVKPKYADNVLLAVGTEIASRNSERSLPHAAATGLLGGKRLNLRSGMHQVA